MDHVASIRHAENRAGRRGQRRRQCRRHGHRRQRVLLADRAIQRENAVAVEGFALSHRGTCTVTVFAATLPDASTHSIVIVYIRPVPLLLRSARKATVRSPVITQSTPVDASLLVTDTIRQRTAPPQLSAADTLTVTGTSCLLGCNSTDGVAEADEITGGVTSMTVTPMESDEDPPRPSWTVNAME